MVRFQFTDVAIVLFEEPPSVPPSSVLNRIIHEAVVHLGGQPPMAHVELLLPSRIMASGADAKSPYFATYIGEHAGWQSAEDAFYLSKLDTLRAVPFALQGGCQAVERVCERCRLPTPARYGLALYPLALRPFQWMSACVADLPNSRAHCAALTARILQKAGGVEGMQALGRHPVTYSPSSLYTALTTAYQRKPWAYETDARVIARASETAEVLMRGSDASIGHLSNDECSQALKWLCDRLHACDYQNKEAAERCLAVAAVRWAHCVATNP